MGVVGFFLLEKEVDLWHRPCPPRRGFVFVSCDVWECYVVFASVYCKSCSVCCKSWFGFGVPWMRFKFDKGNAWVVGNILYFVKVFY